MGPYPQMCDLVCSIIVLCCGRDGVEVLMYDLLQMMVVVSNSVVPILVV